MSVVSATPLAYKGCRLVIVEYSVQCLEEVSLCTGAEDRPPATLNYFQGLFPYNVPVYSGFPNSFMRTAASHHPELFQEDSGARWIFPLPRKL